MRAERLPGRRDAGTGLGSDGILNKRKEGTGQDLEDCLEDCEKTGHWRRAVCLENLGKMKTERVGRKDPRLPSLVELAL